MHHYECPFQEKKRSMKHLICIDDQSIRRQAFHLTGRILQKLDRLESDIESFHLQDQQLFSDWFDLTFRNLRKSLEKHHEEWHDLCKFHNWIIAESKRQGISMARALLFLRSEEASYSDGTTETKAKIEAEREARDQFIRQEIEREFGPSFDPSDFDEADDIEDEGLDRSQEPDAEEEREARKAMDRLNELSDKKLRKICREPGEADAILSMLVSHIRSDQDRDLILRVWSFTPDKYQKQFAREFFEGTGVSFHHILNQLRQDQLENEPQENAESADEAEFDASFQGGQKDSRRGERHGHPKSAQELESFKLLYRKLVRRLHPDLNQESLSKTHWHKKMWARVQHAKQGQNKMALEKLWRLVLIRSGDLNELTLSEIRESHDWLDDELKQLGQEAKALKRLPAWGFSRKKDLKPLKRKLEKGVRAELEKIQDKVEDMKSQHSYLEFVASIESATRLSSRPRRRRKPQQRTKAKVKNVKKKGRPTKESDPNQTSLF